MKYDVKKAHEGYIKESDAARLVFECDQEFEDRLNAEVAKISDREARILRLCGPTCSGKSTVAKKIACEIEKRGKKVHTIAVDDFYYDRDYLNEQSLKNGDGEIDYDSPNTIDVRELKQVISDIDASGELSVPIFDFAEGKRVGYRTIQVSKTDVFLFEGIQVLYPEIKSLFLGYLCVDIYIEPMCDIAVGSEIFDKNEIRFLRRIVRDTRQRNTSPEFTFELWGGVRANEDKNIFPYTLECEFKIEASFAYEIGVLKPYLFEYLSRLPSESEYKAAANDILRRIDAAAEISAEHISASSLYREFI